MDEDLEARWLSAIREQDPVEVGRMLLADPSLAAEPIVFTRGNGSTYRQRPLVVSKTGSLEVVRLLVDAGADVNERDEDGGTTAMSGPTFEIGAYLVSKGADIDAFGYEELTPIAYATYDQNLPLVELLIKKGADVNRAHPAEGIAPLHYAARKCDAAFIRVLINAGANPLLPDAKGETPVDWAVKAKRGEDVMAALTG